MGIGTAMSPTSQSSPSAITSQQEAEQQLEVERIQEVTFLLGQLFEREQQTVKAIVGCLLDVGIINFANRRIRFRPLRPVVKPVARVAKPVLVAFAYRWVRQNCPRLVSRWLRSKVQFCPPQRAIPPSPPPTVVLEPAAAYQHEIRQLRSRLRLTGGALMGVSTVLILILAGVNLQSLRQFSQQKQPNATPIQHTPLPLLQKSQVSIPVLRNQAAD
jgi:hypothetical protein